MTSSQHVFTINPAVVRGLFSPRRERRDRRGVCPSASVLFTPYLCASCASPCLCVCARPCILKIRYQASVMKESTSSVFFIRSLPPRATNQFHFLIWNESCSIKVKYCAGSDVLYSKEENRSIVITDVQKSSLRTNQDRVQASAVLRETNSSMLLVNRGGWVIPFSFQPRLEIRYSMSCPQICSVAN